MILAVKPIDPTVRIQPPDALSVTAAATQFKIPSSDGECVRVSHGAAAFRAGRKKSATLGHGRSTGRIASKQFVTWSWPSFRTAASKETAVRPAVGICLRAINDNDHTEQLLADLNLPSHLIEVVRFYGTGGQGMTVKQVIAQRKGRTCLTCLW